MLQKRLTGGWGSITKQNTGNLLLLLIYAEYHNSPFILLKNKMSPFMARFYLRFSYLLFWIILPSVKGNHKISFDRGPLSTIQFFVAKMYAITNPKTEFWWFPTVNCNTANFASLHGWVLYILRVRLFIKNYSARKKLSLDLQYHDFWGKKILVTVKYHFICNYNDSQNIWE